MKYQFAVLAAASLTLAPAWAYATSADGIEEVVVTATLSARDSATSPAFTSVITRDQINWSPVNSLGDLLREAVGVNNATDPTGRDEIQIRGLGGRYTLILVDGKRVSSSGALWRGGDFDISSIPMSSIERVEIVRGPMAALYGSDAIGGVVNIITKAPTSDWQGSVSAEYRSLETGEKGTQQRYNASAAGALSDSFSLSVSGEVYDRDPWFRHSAADPTEVPALEEKQSASLYTTARWKLSDVQSLDLDISYNNDQRPYALYSYAYYPEWDYESFSYREQEITRSTYGLTHSGNWSWGKTVVFVKQEDSDIDDFNSSYNDPQQRNLKEKNTYAKAYASGDLNHQTLTAGLDYREQTIEDQATYLDTGEVSTRDIALFVQDEIALTEKLNLTLGGRADDHEVFGSHFSPKSYLTYDLGDGIVIKGGVSEAFKAPDAYQTSEEYRVISCGGSCYLAGNPDLKPESSRNYEAGIEVQKNRWNMSLALFSNDVDDMIVAVYDPAGPSREWVNIASAKTQGVELEASADLSASLSLDGNMTYLDTEYRDADGAKAQLDNRPEILSKLALNWQLGSSLRTSLAAYYTGTQYYEGAKLPGYTRLDWTAAYSLNKSLVLRAGVKNLTDVNLDEKNEHFITQELGRNFYLSASYSF